MHKLIFPAVLRALFVATLGISTAQASSLEYSLTALGVNEWRYDYTLKVDAIDPSFDELTVYFDLPKVSSITSFLTPAGWDGIFVQPDPLIPDGGYIDALSLSGPVAAGSTLPGFSVTFSYISGEIPGAQRFELLNSNLFQTVSSGVTIAASVPEPESYAMLLAGLSVLAFGHRLRSRKLSGVMLENQGA